MVDIVTRAGKGSPLTNNEVDANFTNLAEVAGVTGEPMGHEDRTTSTISFNASTRTFTIAPVSTSFTVWCKGKKVVVSSAQTVTIPNTTGMYSIYYDANGVLAAKAGYFTFSVEAPTAYVYWNAATGTCPYFGDERHGVVLDWQTHEYLHRTRGAALASGFAASGYTLGGNGSSNAHAQLTLEGGTFFDEDMKIIVTATNTPTAGTWEQDLLSPARIPVLYLSGTGWVIDAPTDYPLKQGTARPQYNALSGGVWSTADVANNKYATSWILATNNLTYPVIAIIGQAESDLQSAAEAVDFTSLQLPGFPSVEFRPLYRLVFQCADSFSNAVKASLVSITDIRSIAAAGVAASLITDHGNLSGLSDDDHPQYLSVDTVRSTLTAAVKASFLPSQTGNAGKFLTTDATSTSWTALTSGNITTALGFTPYNATNPAGYITGITSSDVTTALGFTPYNATNPSGYITTAGARGAISVTGAGSYDSATGVINIVGGVTSFNTRTGAITLSSADVTTALGFTPYNSTNPNGYLTGITSMQVTTALGYTPYNSSNPSGYITGITSGMVTTALGYTPYNSSNPSGYITSSALSSYLPLSGGTVTGLITSNVGGSGYGRINGSDQYHALILRGSVAGTTSQTVTAGDTMEFIEFGGVWNFRKVSDTVNQVYATINTSGISWNGNTVLHAGNYTSYRPPILAPINTTATGISNWNPGSLTYQAWGQSFTNTNISTDSGDLTLWLRPSQYLGGGTELNMYIDGDYYSGTGVAKVLNASNYTSYSPSLTGSGSSGTWGISVTGSAGSLTNFVNQSGSRYTTDVNSLLQTGFYNTEGIPTNSPVGYGQIIVAKGIDTGLQIAGGYNSDQLYFRGWANYGSIMYSWRTLLHNGNYNNYSPTLTGGNASGTWSINVTGSAGSISGYNNPTTAATGNTIAYRDNNGDIAVRELVMTQVVQTFTPSSLIAVYPTTNQAVKVSASGARAFLDVPTRGGGDASGTWGINVTGTARALDSGHYIYRTGTSGNLNTDFGNIPAGTMRHAGDDSSVTNSPGGTWWFYDHYRHSNSSNYWGTQVAWGWEDNGNRLAQRNVSAGSWSGWVYYLNSGNYSSYAVPIGGGTMTGLLTVNHFGNGNPSITVNSGGSENWRAISVRAAAGGDNFGIGYSNSGHSAFGRNNLSLHCGAGDSVRFHSDGWDTLFEVAGATGNAWFKNDIYFGGSSTYLFGRNVWAGTTGYPGYAYAGGNSRFGFSSSGGYIDVYTDGDFYAGIDFNGSNNKVLHAGNYTSYSPSLGGSGASGTWGINITGSAQVSNTLSNYGYGSGQQTWYQTSGNFQTWTGGWASHIISNHGDGATYYNQTIIMPFWSAPQYMRKEGGTNTGPWTFVTTENYTSYTVPVGGGTFTGSITSNGNVTAYSDERKKTNWRGYTTDFVEQLAKVKNGTYDRTDMTLTQDGVSAQSLQGVLPNSISQDADGMLSVNYGGAALASAVELAKRVVDQEKRIAHLESLISKLIGD